MSTPLEVIEEGERELKTAHADMFKGRVSALYVDKLVTSQTLALLQALHDELEGKKKVEKQIHTPNCMRGTSTTGHSYCSMSEEDEGYNQAIQDQEDNLQALMDKITK